jgi:hypothetical protein
MVSDAQFSFEMEEMQKSAAKDKVRSHHIGHRTRAPHATHWTCNARPGRRTRVSPWLRGGAARCDRARRAGRW